MTVAGLPVAAHVELHLVTGAVGEDLGREVARGLDRRAVEGGDHVAGLDAGGGGGSPADTVATWAPG